MYDEYKELFGELDAADPEAKMRVIDKLTSYFLAQPPKIPILCALNMAFFEGISPIGLFELVKILTRLKVIRGRSEQLSASSKSTCGRFYLGHCLLVTLRTS